MLLKTHLLPCLLGALVQVSLASHMLERCLLASPRYMMNVVLLEDTTYEWSLRYVREAVEKAIAIDHRINIDMGMDGSMHGLSFF